VMSMTLPAAPPALWPEPHPWSPSHQTGLADDPSIVPALEPIR